MLRPTLVVQKKRTKFSVLPSHLPSNVFFPCLPSQKAPKLVFPSKTQPSLCGSVVVSSECSPEEEARLAPEC